MVARVQARLDAVAPEPGGTADRKRNRGNLPAHLERVERLADVDEKTCRCCGSELHVMGEGVTERPDVVPASFRVLVTRRPR